MGKKNVSNLTPHESTLSIDQRLPQKSVSGS